MLLTVEIPNTFAAIILAAGKGTRLNSNIKNKVLQPLAGRPMIDYTVDTLKKTGLKTLLFITGFKGDGVKQHLGDQYLYAQQSKRLGTGHAVKVALSALPYQTTDVIVLYGDHSAFYSSEMIQKLIHQHLQTNSQISLLTAIADGNTDYGRILRDKDQQIIGIREVKDASPQELKIREINPGCYCFSIDFLKKYLPRIKKNPLKGEYYLTDLIALAVENLIPIQTYKVPLEAIGIGVNTAEQLASANELMSQKLK